MTILKFPIDRVRPRQDPDLTCLTPVASIDWFEVIKEICRPGLCIYCGTVLAGGSFRAACQSCAPPQ